VVWEWTSSSSSSSWESRETELKSVPTCCNCDPASYRGCSHAKQESQPTRNLWRQHRSQQRGRSSRNTQHLIDHSPLLFAAPISGISSNHKKKPATVNSWCEVQLRENLGDLYLQKT
jgi:hypothetical protein